MHFIWKTLKLELLDQFWEYHQYNYGNRMNGILFQTELKLHLERAKIFAVSNDKRILHETKNLFR